MWHAQLKEHGKKTHMRSRPEDPDDEASVVNALRRLEDDVRMWRHCSAERDVPKKKPFNEEPPCGRSKRDRKRDGPRAKKQWPVGSSPASPNLFMDTNIRLSILSVALKLFERGPRPSLL